MMMMMRTNLRLDPSDRRRKPAGQQQVLVSSTIAQHTTAEQASQASEQTVAELTAEEAATYSDTRANTTIHAVGETALLVTAATEATPSEGKSQAVPDSLLFIATGSNASAVD
jgi:hypothetical protein